MTPSRLIRLALPWVLLLAAQSSMAGGWGVAPIRVVFDGSSRTAALRLESSTDVPLNFQLRLMRWTQTADGEDRFEASEDLLYFPRALVLPPGEERVIRIGTKARVPALEQTYRLFVEELPPATDESGGSRIAVRLRFGVPIFFGPTRPHPRADILDPRVEAGQLRMRISNRGNQHLQFDAVRIVQGERELGATRGWYLLPGSGRDYAVALNPDSCRPGPASIRLRTLNGLDLAQDVTIPTGQCDSGH